MSKGTLFIISSPSGAGKSSLIQALLKTQSLYNTNLSISYTTRQIRPGEHNGKHYFFIDHDEFIQMINKEIFLEYAKVFGHYYGTSKKTIEQTLSKGIDVLLDIDWQGAKQIREKMPLVCSIFLLPPSKDELNRRLRQRNQDSKEVIAKRMSQAINEMRHYSDYDYLIVNDNFNLALLDLKIIISAERLCTYRQKKLHNVLISKLLTE